ncbi:MAG: hypothetical protein K8S97_05915, partial [Anaerolineae bacterium]|nr:hypothetical protein [Anaerolineae bacterium]
MTQQDSTRDAESLPRWVWISTLTGVVAVITVIAVVALWIASGATDQPVAETVVWSDTTFEWTNQAEITLGAETGAWWPAPESLPAGDFTLTVRATFAEGADPLTAWGVWIAAEDRSRVLYAISAGGYWTIRTCPADPPPTEIEQCPALDPTWRWSPFPRIEPPGTPNTLTLHREPDGALRLR